MSNRCEEEKIKFLRAYDCYDMKARDSLAEVLCIIPVSDFAHYEETPENAVIFAMTGTDGCHYCMTENGDNINVFIILPNMGDEHSVYLIGHSISEMLSYALPIQGLFECVFELDRNTFLQEVQNLKDERATELNSERFLDDLSAIKREFTVTNYSAITVYEKLRAMNYLSDSET